MRKHTSFVSSYSSSNIDGNTDPYRDCTYNSSNHPQTPLSESSSFISCTFTSLASETRGGALEFTAGGSNEIVDCIFTHCSSSISIDNDYGGGAVFSNSGSLLSVSSSAFISCTTKSVGGDLFCISGCESAAVSGCFFFGCSSESSGGGMCTHYGPICTVSSTVFTLCTAEWSGGGIYHNSLSDASDISISDSLFK